MSRKVLITVILVALGFLFYIRVNVIDSLTVTVIDGQTLEPLPGAILLAWWPLYLSSPAGVHDQGIMAVVEAVADKSGRVGYDGFVKIVPWHRGWLRKSASPKLVVYAEGYQDLLLSSSTGQQAEKIRERYLADDNGQENFWRGANLDGATIELLPLQGSSSQAYRRSNLVRCLWDLEHSTSYRCLWDQIPNSFVYLYAMRGQAAQENLEPYLLGVAESLGEDTNCTETQSFIRRYIKQ